MLKPITKSQFEDIHFNPNISIVEKSWTTCRGCVTVLINGVDIIAKRVITSTGVKYYAVS